MGIAKTAADSVYAYKFVRLMQKPFITWDAYGKGIIDDKGNLLKRPTNKSEKEAYTPFHASIRSMKRMLSTIPGLTGMSSFMSGLSAVASRYGITESEQKEICKQILGEDMVAGDSGGSIENIGSGTTTGASANKGPLSIPGNIRPTPKNKATRRKRMKISTDKL